MHPQRLINRFTPTLALYFLAVALFFTGFAAFFAPLPAFLTDAGFSSDGIFVLYVVSSLAAAAFFGYAGTLATRHDIALLQSLGLGIRGVLLPVVAVIGIVLGAGMLALVSGAIVFAIIGLSWAVVAVTAGTLVTRLSPPAVRGEALGMYSALSAFAGGIGSIVGGWLAATGYLLAFGVAGGFVAAGALVVVRLRTRKPADATLDEDSTSSLPHNHRESRQRSDNQ